jgi:hypothetical protein
VYNAVSRFFPPEKHTQKAIKLMLENLYMLHAPRNAEAAGVTGQGNFAHAVQRISELLKWKWRRRCF